MSKIYRAEVTVVLYVLAQDEAGAERTALRAAEHELRHKARVVVTGATSSSLRDDGWSGAPPYHQSMKTAAEAGVTSCIEILRTEERLDGA
jgi:hypothetical protein